MLILGIDFFNQLDMNVSQKNIYFLKKLSSIMSYKFSYDFSLIIIIIDEFTVGIWDTFYGNITSFWHFPNIPNLFKSIAITSNESFLTLMSIKEDENLINIYNYYDGNLIFSLDEFDAYNCSFSHNGEKLLLGTSGGEEICRLYNLNNVNYEKFYNYNKQI
jgi:WD40 repeat protein